MLNDPAQLEASRALANLLIKSASKSEVRLDLAFERILSRHPDPEEVAALVAFVVARQKEFQANPVQAMALLGKTAKDKLANAVLAEQAAWTSLVRLLFNLDETLVKR